MNQLLAPTSLPAPALVAAIGERASYRFFEFFTAQIRYPHTRAPMRERRSNSSTGLRLTAIESVHVAAYAEQLQKARSAPTAQHFLALQP